MTNPKITVEFSFDELAGLYFIANAGLISVIMNTMVKQVELSSPEQDGARYKEADMDYREAVLAFRENGNADSIINKLEAMRQQLIDAAPKPAEA